MRDSFCACRHPRARSPTQPCPLQHWEKLTLISFFAADTHLAQDYFSEVRRFHYAHPTDARRTLYTCPIIFDRNAHNIPALVRCADLLWAMAGISALVEPWPISIPTSVYSLPLALAEAVGGWDADPTAIGEDMHMLLKCVVRVVTRLDCRVLMDTVDVTSAPPAPSSLGLSSVLRASAMSRALGREAR
jgi:hypothetical protein